VRSLLRPLFFCASGRLSLAAAAAGAALGVACGGSNGSTAPHGDGGELDATGPGDGSIADTGGDTAKGSDAGSADSASASDAGPVVGTTITVDPKTTLGAIGPGFVGLSYEKAHLEDGYFRGDNAALVAMVDLLGPSVLRVGGNSVDETVWQTYDAGAPGDAAAPAVITHAEVDGLAAFAKAANWKVIYGVNLKLSSAPVAEDEARYAATDLGSNLYGFEIGNECDLYTQVVSSPGTWTYDTFKTDWESFAAAIRAGTPAAPLTGPASASHYATWTVPFAADEASKIDLLTQHYYRANGQLATSTIDFLLTPDTDLPKELAALSAAATTNKVQSQYRLAECNSFYNGGAPNVSDAFGTALWAIDFLFTNAENGSTGVNFHGGGNGTGYTPIADTGGNVVGARPIFYGMLLFTKAGQGSVVKTTGGPTGLNFSSYAVALAGSPKSIVLSNKDRTTTVHATVDVGATLTSAQATRLAAPSLDSPTGETLGGVAIGNDGTFTPDAPEALATAGTTFTVDVPPGSAVLVSVQ
jgi:hypothetical protein